jgi:phosphodiesterase/alkaline phosphatase D-like protein
MYSGHLIPAAGNAGLTIDRSTNDLYVDQGGYIQQFATVVPPGCAKDAGAGTIGQGCGATDTFGSGSLTGGAGLGFNPGTGMLYAADAGANDVAVFSPLPLPDVTTGPATGVDATSGTLTGEVDPHGVGQVSDCYFQYGTDSSYGLGSIPCSPGAPLSGPADVTAEVGGLTPSTTYHYRLVAIRADGKGLPAYGRDHTFTASPPLAPTIESSSAANATPTTAVVEARINPNLLPTVYRFQYGRDTDYGSQTPTSDSIGEDAGGHTVSSLLSGLTPGATYHYRVVAVNFNGVTNGPDGTFTTPNAPTVTAGAAVNVSPTSATLTAGIRPGLRSTTYHFEYGPTASYGTSTRESSPIGSDTAVHSVAAGISGLSAATTYHFRAVATNAIGTSDGPDQTFVTAPIPIQSPPPSKCKAGLVKRGGKCVRRRHHKHKRKKRSNP